MPLGEMDVCRAAEMVGSKASWLWFAHVASPIVHTRMDDVTGLARGGGSQFFDYLDFLVASYLLVSLDMVCGLLYIYMYVSDGLGIPT